MITQQTDIEFLSGLAKSSVDLCLTDPPYIISKDSGMDRLLRSEDVDEKYGRKYAYATDYGDWDKDFTMNDLDQSIYLIKRALREGGSFIVFFDMWKLETLKNILEFHKFSKIRIVEWVKTNPVPVNSKATYLSNAKEYALSCVKGGKATFNSSYDNGIYSYPIYSGKDRFHPTQKSLPLFAELIEKHSNKGDLVIDPYAGSGTTMLAAANTGRVGLGCEPNEEYFKLSKQRLSNA